MKPNSILALFTLAAFAFVGCSTAPDTQSGRKDLHMETADTIETFTRTDPGMRSFLDHSYGYAVIPTVAKGGLIVGGAYGKGEVDEKGMMVGWCDLAQAT